MVEKILLFRSNLILKKILLSLCCLLLFFSVLVPSIIFALNGKVEEIVPNEKVEEIVPEAKFEKIVMEMTTEQKIGQLLLMDFRKWKTSTDANATDFEYMNSEVAKIIADYHIGNIILFRENLKDTEKSTRLVGELQNAAIAQGDLPLIISTDQEGGIVTRLGQGTCMPGNMALGATNNTECAFSCGKVIAKELSSIGINCNHAPVVDINNNPANPVIHLRSFGSDQDLVSKMGVAMMKGMQDERIISTAKHFPGHGNTSVDSHTGLPLVTKNMDELNGLELIPFKALIDNGIDTIMTAHIQFPNIDNTTYISKKDGSQIYAPATLSKKILTDILRDTLGFKGVITTDAMNMAAISENFGQIQSIKLAINAGVDLICMPTTITSTQDTYKLDAIYSGIKAAIESGEIPLSRIDESVKRIVKLKEDKGILVLKEEKIPIDQRVEKALKTVGCEEHRKIERNISENAITLIRNNNMLPFKPTQTQKVLLIAPFENEIPAMKFAINRLIDGNKIPNIQIETYCYKENVFPTDELKLKVEKSDYIIMLTEVCGNEYLNKQNWKTALPTKTLMFINSINKPIKTAVVSIGSPYDIVNYNSAPVLMVAYGYQGMDPTDLQSGNITKFFGPNIPAAVESCFSDVLPKGKLPINVDVR